MGSAGGKSAYLARWIPRLLAIAAIFAVCFVAVALLDRYIRCSRWSPEITIEGEHYVAESRVPEDRTRDALMAAEALRAAYVGLLGDAVPLAPDHPKLKLRIYESRFEFRLCSEASSWAEAYYRAPYSHQYISTGGASPFHWMLHESTHQLSSEVANLKLRRWLSEGLACYFGTSTLKSDTLHLGLIDAGTYPIWWLPKLGPSGDMASDVENQRVIPLERILTGSGGPDIDTHFNTYYLHWWSVTHFCLHYDNGRFRDGFLAVIRDGGSYESFVEHVGPVDEIQPLWYEHFVVQSQDAAAR